MFAKNRLIMDGFEKKDNGKDRDDIFSKSVRAGKRTYFFDVKSTKQNEYYLTITESKKRFGEDGNSHFEKHKIFLYKEDFEKFAEGLGEVITYINSNQPEVAATADYDPEAFTKLEFEDFESK